MKELIARYLDGQAAWREAKADEYPEDERNARSALALSQLAQHVRCLPDDDPRIAELARIHSTHGLDVFRPCEAANRLISRYGFNAHGGNHDDALDTLVQAEQGDAQTVAR
jgi:hypothetical protein